VSVEQHQLADWEWRIEALSSVVKDRHGGRLDRLRAAIEALPAERYATLGYHERWAAAIEDVLVADGVIHREDVDRRAEQLRRRWAGG